MILPKRNTRTAQALIWLILLGFLVTGCVSYLSQSSPTTSPVVTSTSALLPDLWPLSVTVESDSAIDCENQSLVTRVTIENKGNADTLAFQVTLNGVSKTIQEGLTVGGRIELTFPVYFSDTYIIVDPSNQVIENNEDNNRLDARLEQPALPQACLPTPTPAIISQYPLKTLQGHTAKVLSIDFSPDGSLLASGSIDNTLRLWRVDQAQLLRTMTGHPFPVLKVAFSNSGASIATGSTDGILRIWQVSNGLLIHTLAGHAGWLTDISYSPNSKYLATCSDDFTVRVWRIVDYRQMDVIDEGMSAINKLSYSPDSKQLAWAEQDGSVRLWQMDSKIGRLLFKSDQPAKSLTYSPDGRFLVVGFGDGRLRAWAFREDAVNSEPHLVIDAPAHQRAISDLAFSPDGSWLASASGDQTLKLWHFEPVAPGAGEPSDQKIYLTPIYLYVGHQAAINSLSFSPQGDLIASASDDQTICLWPVPKQ